MVVEIVIVILEINVGLEELLWQTYRGLYSTESYLMRLFVASCVLE